jgi:hypothetical protein
MPEQNDVLNYFKLFNIQYSNIGYLMRQCHDIFDLCFFFYKNNPIKVPDLRSKILSNFVVNSPLYKQICVVPRYGA